MNTVMSYTDLGNHSGLGPVRHRRRPAPLRHQRGGGSGWRCAGRAGPTARLSAWATTPSNTITGLAIRDIVRGRRRQRPHPVRGGNDVILPGAGSGHGVRRRRLRHRLGGERRGGTRRWPSSAGPRDAGAAGRHRPLLPGRNHPLLRRPSGPHAAIPRRARSSASTAPRSAASPTRSASATGPGAEAGATSLEGAAAGFVGSAEFAARFGAPDNAGFVTLLYGNVLGRAPDAAGLNHWMTVMATGAQPRRRAARLLRIGRVQAAHGGRLRQPGSGFRTRRRWTCCAPMWRCWTACRTPGLGGLDGGARGRARAVRPDRAVRPRRSSRPGSAGCPTATSWSSSTARRWTARRTRTGWRPGRACSTPGSTAGRVWRSASPAAPR